MNLSVFGSQIENDPFKRTFSESISVPLARTTNNIYILSLSPTHCLRSSPILSDMHVLSLQSSDVTLLFFP